MWLRSATAAVLIAGATSGRASRRGRSGRAGGDSHEILAVPGSLGEEEEEEEEEEGGGEDTQLGPTTEKTVW